MDTQRYRIKKTSTGKLKPNEKKKIEEHESKALIAMAFSKGGSDGRTASGNMTVEAVMTKLLEKTDGTWDAPGVGKIPRAEGNDFTYFTFRVSTEAAAKRRSRGMKTTRDTPSTR